MLNICELFSIFSSAQELPTEPAKGFAFPLGTKFTIKLHPTDSSYSIIPSLSLSHSKKSSIVGKRINCLKKKESTTQLNFIFAWEHTARPRKRSKKI